MNPNATFVKTVCEVVQFAARHDTDVDYYRRLPNTRLVAELSSDQKRIATILHARAVRMMEGTETSEYHVLVPADWWQAVRERWAPRWWLRRHPVTFRKIVHKTVATTYRLCPHVKIPDNLACALAPEQPS